MLKNDADELADWMIKRNLSWKYLKSFKCLRVSKETALDPLLIPVDELKALEVNDIKFKIIKHFKLLDLAKEPVAKHNRPNKWNF